MECEIQHLLQIKCQVLNSAIYTSKFNKPRWKSTDLCFLKRTYLHIDTKTHMFLLKVPVICVFKAELINFFI